MPCFSGNGHVSFTPNNARVAMEKTRRTLAYLPNLRGLQAVRALPVMGRRCGLSVRVCRPGRRPVASDLFGRLFPKLTPV